MERAQAYGSTVRATLRTTMILNVRKLNTSCAWRLVAGCKYRTGSVGVRYAFALPSARCVNPDCPANPSMVDTSKVSCVRASLRVHRRGVQGVQRRRVVVLEDRASLHEAPSRRPDASPARVEVCPAVDAPPRSARFSACEFGAAGMKRNPGFASQYAVIAAV